MASDDPTSGVRSIVTGGARNRQLLTTSFRTHAVGLPAVQHSSTHHLSASAHRHLSCATPVTDSEKMKKNEDWLRVQSAILGLFQKIKIAENQLCSLRVSVKNLIDSKIGTLIFDFYMKQALTKGMVLLRENIRLHRGEQQLERLNDSWLHVYCDVIPNVQAIFYPFKPKNLSIRQTCLVYFRDVILLNILVTDTSLRDFKKISNRTQPGIQQMLLMLQSVHDSFPPNSNRLALERLVAAVVIPYLGFNGIYEGGPEPVIRSREPQLVTKKYWSSNSTECSLLRRHWSCQAFKSINTLEDMFHSAYSRNTHDDEES